jgi:hypothetical protein
MDFYALDLGFIILENPYFLPFVTSKAWTKVLRAWTKVHRPSKKPCFLPFIISEDMNLFSP